MKEFEFNQSREYLLKRMGDISQIAGLKRYTLTDGRAFGTEAVDFRSGTGFDFTVLPGRGMDIAWASFRGMPFAYMSKTGLVSPSFYESSGMNWLRSFYGGLLTTCGLQNVGGPANEMHAVLGMQHFGLHGRIANMPAEHFGMSERWEGNRLTLTVSGKVREAQLHAEKLTLHRRISCQMGENRLFIHDVIENESFTQQPLMLLYHINLGYPVLNKGARILIPSKSVSPNDDFSASMMNEFATVSEPINGIFENVYFHDTEADDEGRVCAALINDDLELGVYIRFKKAQLPCFTQWKMMGESEYVLGLEPGNCTPKGREWHRNEGTLEILEPGAQKQVMLEIGILPDAASIQSAEELKNKTI